MDKELLHEDFVSVVIPAYNEEFRIQPTLERLSSYLSRSFREFELIVVDDGSSDSTASVVQNVSRRLGNIRLLRYAPNMGKGYAVKRGVLSSSGEYVLMCDADMSTPIEEIEKLYSYLRGGFDIAIGSRALRESDIVLRQPWYRERMGKTFNLFVRALVMGGFKDTQCGFKLFRKEPAKEIFSRSCINGFSFDVEVLYLARKSGFRIQEVPIRWIDSPLSRVTLLRDPVRMFLDLFRIRMNWISGKYRQIK